MNINTGEMSKQNTYFRTLILRDGLICSAKPHLHSRFLRMRSQRGAHQAGHGYDRHELRPQQPSAACNCYMYVLRQAQRVTPFHIPVENRKGAILVNGPSRFCTTFLDWTPLLFTAMAWIFIPAYCFAVP